MMSSGHLKVLIGSDVPKPAPPELTEAIQSVSVTLKDEGKSGFQLVVQVGRSGTSDVRDYPLLADPLLSLFNRVILTVALGGTPHVLVDGVITTREFLPGGQPGAAILTLTGEDVSVMMDLKKRRAQFPAMSDVMIATQIIGSYSEYGLVPVVTPPPTIDQPAPTDRIPVHQGTDLEILNEIAKKAGWVFFVEPGPTPGMNRGYWGPPPHADALQAPLNVNMGAETNVSSLSFTHNGLAATQISDTIQDQKTETPVEVFASTRDTLLSANTALPSGQAAARSGLLEPNSGMSVTEARDRAQAITNRSLDEVVTVQGELDAIRYGAVLRPRSTVSVRGAGWTNDGTYYVKSVSHSIKRGKYKQRFTLSRDGVGALTEAVIV